MIPETRERLQDSERAVSPVIGVILMVAITVILAAVIAAFVLGFGADQDSAPQATLSVDQVNASGGTGDLVFNHEGGDGIDNATIGLVGDFSVASSPSDDTFTGGESFTYGLEDAFAGTEVDLVWQPGTDDSQILRTVTLSEDWGTSSS